MSTQPPSMAGFDPVTGQPLASQPAPAEKKLLAPLWHTLLIVLLLVGNSVLSAITAARATAAGSGAISERMRITQYAFTVGLELFLLFLVWVGLRLRQHTVRELIGGRWDKPEAFLIDIAVAAGFWVSAVIVLYGVSWLVGLAKPGQVQDAKKLAQALAPQSVNGLILFVVLSIVAGFVEEIIFRGYLQRQLGALSGNIYVGLVVSALIFGCSHGYEGYRRMIVIFVFGMMFGFLALWRKSLRPGMFAHAWHDSFAGVALYIFSRKGFPSM